MKDDDLDQVNQHINGENHQIAGHDINYFQNSEPEFEDGNPYKISCPQCEKVIGRFSENCKNCDFPVKRHFDDIELEQQKQIQRDKRNALHNKGLILTYGGMLGVGLLNWLGFTDVLFLAPVIVCMLSGVVILKISTS